MARTDRTQVVFTPIPITGLIGCTIPVTPAGSWDAPIEERTELCAIDANWIVGSAPTCDVHVKQVCEMTDIDWPELVAEAGRDLEQANRPASQREQYTQAQARESKEHFMHEEARNV